MTRTRLIVRSLRFYWRQHLGTFLGVVVGSAVLMGALVVGDSVRASLRRLALLRLGRVEVALASHDRYFRSQLASELEIGFSQSGMAPPGQVTVVPALQMAGVAAAGDATRHAQRVHILGVDNRFWQLTETARRYHEARNRGGSGTTQAVTNDYLRLAPLLNALIPAEAVVLNEALAEQLQAKTGDAVVFRLEKPTQLSGDAPLAPGERTSVALRLRVHRIVPDEHLGRFSLESSQLAPFNAFVSLSALQDRTGLGRRANLLLLGQTLPSILQVSRPLLSYVPQPRKPLDLAPLAAVLLGQRWQLEDAELQLKELPELGALELRTSRVFFDSAVAEAALGGVTNLKSRPRASPVLPPTGYSAPLQSSGVLPASPGGRSPSQRPGPTPQVAGPGLTTPYAVSPAATTILHNFKPVGILTYLVNEIRAGQRTTPYSMVSAVGQGLAPAGMTDEEILLNEWLAQDLGAGPGDEVTLTYFVVGNQRQLEERSARLRVRSVIPMNAPGLDRTLMPDFPGLANAQDCRDWDAGLPIDTARIRPKDEEYWDKYRGTPKAIVTLAAGRKLWHNRFGNLTLARFYAPGMLESLAPSGAAPLSQRPRVAPYLGSYRQALQAQVLASLEPSMFGLTFLPVREQALKAAAQAQDFGQLFLGFSAFLITAALLLMSLLLQFGLEQRATETGALRAVGFTVGRARRLLLVEQGVLAVLGSLAGAWCATWYARLMLHGLATNWKEAVGNLVLQYHTAWQTLCLGVLVSILVSGATMWLALRRQARRSLSGLLASGAEIESAGAGPGGSRTQWSAAKRSWVLALLCAGVAGALVVRGVVQGLSAAAGLFFGAGALLLSAGLAAGSGWLGRLAVSESAARLSLGGMVVRSLTRRPKRSLSTAGLLACGSFLIVSIGVFRLDAVRDADRRSSGTGGFALVGETTHPVIHDLNSGSGREFYALDTNRVAGMAVAPFRVRDGDEASCLNLNRAQTPRLLGVRPEVLQERGAFTFAQVAQGRSRNQPWLLLRRQPGDEAVPAIGDQASIAWALGRKVGDVLFFTDQRGRPFKVRLVGALANSILQGNLIIAEDEFTARFPSVTGYRFFLLDAPPGAVKSITAEMERALKDLGIELTPAARRLAALSAVQNTYLGTFQALGGLGLILGSAGLGAVVLRNVLERRGELALLLAVGFRRRELKQLVFREHSLLLLGGLGIGLVAAVFAVLPSVLSPGARIPFGWLAFTLAATLGNGALWAWLATVLALRGDLLSALRNN